MYTTNTYETMQAWELLAERSHAEQLGHIGELMVYEIDTELERRRAEAPATLVKEEKQEAKPEGHVLAIVNYHRHAKAVIYDNGMVRFFGKSGGLGCIDLSVQEVWHGKYLLSFYNGSEYVTNGILARTQLKLREMGL